MKEASHLLANVVWCNDTYAALEGGDALVILTEWNEFRALDFERVKKMLKTPIVVDLRNIYKPADMAAAGFSYSSIGRAIPKKA
jgi:UDPglucose 6-dehydrogenase